MYLYQDLGEEDEAQIPLLPGWIRTMKFVNDGGTIQIYRNVDNGNESEEHPLLLQAMNAAR